MTALEIPRFGELLAPFIGRVPGPAMPRFLALLERGAADRYRIWADQLPEHRNGLLECAESEDEIADRIEGAFALDESLRPALEAPLPEALSTYYEVFSAYDIWDQLRIQANAERQGANAWRGIASSHPDQAVIRILESCSVLEEASADYLDRLIAEHAP
ncbi:MAG: hypothetical protein RL391_1377 [Actinomycetota bacterium]|jgi:hypothetical protein